MMHNSWEPHQWQGIRFPDNGQLRIDGVAAGVNDGEPLQLGSITVRSDVWPQWLTIAGEALAAARAARETNPGPDGGAEFDRAVLHEYRSAMVSICASAFTFEAFTNSVAELCPNAQGSERISNITERERQSASARFHQIWLRAFRLSNINSANTKETLEQVLALRNEAVHATARFVEPVNHRTYPVALERRFLIYTVENADVSYRLTVDALAHLLARPRGEDPDWTAWCAAMAERLRNIPTGPAA